MQSQSEPPSKPATQSPAVAHIAGAHQKMKELQARVGEHPELMEAIHNLEMALSILTVNTAGVL